MCVPGMCVLVSRAACKSQWNVQSTYENTVPNNKHRKVNKMQPLPERSPSPWGGGGG